MINLMDFSLDLLFFFNQFEKILLLSTWRSSARILFCCISENKHFLHLNVQEGVFQLEVAHQDRIEFRGVLLSFGFEVVDLIFHGRQGTRTRFNLIRHLFKLVFVPILHIDPQKLYLSRKE